MSDPLFRLYQDQSGDWRWTFYAANGLKVADSAEGYRNQKDCIHGMMIVKAHAGKAKVEGIQPTQAQMAEEMAARRRRLAIALMQR
jgi:uncharacterized protein YegP (UPF0339 family)